MATYHLERNVQPRCKIFSGYRSMTTKLTKTLQALQKAGFYGMHSFPLMKEVGTTRVAARVNDLKKQGYIIESKRETLYGVEGCRYYLKGKKQGSTIKEKPIIVYRFEGDRAIPITL